MQISEKKNGKQYFYPCFVAEEFCSFSLRLIQGIREILSVHDEDNKVFWRVAETQKF